MRIARAASVCSLLCLGVPACTRVNVRREKPPRLVIRAEQAAEGASSGDVLVLAVGRLLRTINAERESRGAAELRVDRGLALVAQEAGEEYRRLGRGFEQRVAARANADLRSFSLVFGRVAAVVVFVERLEHAEAVLEPALDPEMRFVGISVAKSPPPTSQHGGYAVVLALGR